MINPRLLQGVLGLLAFVALQVGVWATFFPQSFYDDFPGAGRVWVAVDGPFNEHLIRDVGGLNLALAVVTVWALVTVGRTAILVASGAWIVYSLPHFIYHVGHLDPYDSGSDKAALVVSLGLAVVVPALLAWTAWRRPAST